jgi:hypothetical protein
MAITEEKTTKSRFLRSATEFVWPFGAFQNTKDPHKAIENLERASAKATLWILGGIILDLFALAIFSHDWGERLVGIVANAAIGFGLVVEYLVIGKVIDATKEAERESNERIVKIEAAAAESKREASAAQLETYRIKNVVSWRELPIWQVGTLLSALTAISGPKGVNLRYVEGDPEALYFAIQLSKIFSDAGWQVGSCGFSLSNTLLFGLFLPDVAEQNSLPLREAFKQAKISFASDAVPPPNITYNEVVIGGAPRVIVGSKRPPQFPKKT